MSKELQIAFPAVGNLYAVLNKPDGTGDVWNGTTYIPASIDDRSTSPIVVNRQGTTWLYFGDLPAGVGTTPLNATYYLQATGSPLVSDAPVGVGAVNDATTLAPTGLDNIMVESGLNARQALSVIAAGGGGFLSGATFGPSTITISAAGISGTPRVVAVVDGLGNRTSVTLHPPA